MNIELKLDPLFTQKYYSIPTHTMVQEGQRNKKNIKKTECIKIKQAMDSINISLAECNKIKQIKIVSTLNKQ